MQEVELIGIPSTENALKILRDFADQVPFATAKALTETAGRVSEAEIDELKSRFTIRREWFKRGTRFGINVQPANKTTLQAKVFNRAPWLIRQDQGGQRTPGAYDDLTIPEQGIRQSSDRLIPRALSPRKVMGNAKKMRAFRLKDTIFQRTEDGLRALFFLKSKVSIPKRFDFVGTGKTTVERVYQKEFGKALAYAIATRKP